MAEKTAADVGVVGLGVMGQNLALNLADHGFQSAQFPANLVQAPRDYFGAHTYEPTDQPRGASFHLDWPALQRPQLQVATAAEADKDAGGEER